MPQGESIRLIQIVIELIMHVAPSFNLLSIQMEWYPESKAGLTLIEDVVVMLYNVYLNCHERLLFY